MTTIETTTDDGTVQVLNTLIYVISGLIDGFAPETHEDEDLLDSALSVERQLIAGLH